MTAALDPTKRHTYLEYHRIALNPDQVMPAENILMGLKDTTGTLEDPLLESLTWVAQRIENTAGHTLSPVGLGSPNLPEDKTIYFNVFIATTSWLRYAVAFPMYLNDENSVQPYQYLQRQHLLHTPRGNEKFSSAFNILFREINMGSNKTLRLSYILGKPDAIDPFTYSPFLHYSSREALRSITPALEILDDAPESVNIVEFDDPQVLDVRNAGDDLIHTLSIIEKPVLSSAILLLCNKATSKIQLERDNYAITDPWAV